MRALYAAVAAVLLLVGLPGSAAAAPPPAAVCDLVAPDVVALVRSDVQLRDLAGPAAAKITDQQVLDARRQLGCGPAPVRTPDQTRAALCGSLTVATLEQLAGYADDPRYAAQVDGAQVKALIGISRPVLDAILAGARARFGCPASVTTTPPAASSATVAPSIELDSPDDYSQVGDVPVGGAETGG